ncbi:hypothetical protein LCGC14_0382620 [marine sediment metagenome]|uniref:Uncharacterized protein n=1 Tax=marine sediment metagenome TaxID=412755 RepID=A0A0F9WAV9_9ZZZZ
MTDSFFHGCDKQHPLGGTKPHPTSSCVPGNRAQPWTNE